MSKNCRLISECFRLPILIYCSAIYYLVNDILRERRSDLSTNQLTGTVDCRCKIITDNCYENKYGQQLENDFLTYTIILHERHRSYCPAFVPLRKRTIYLHFC